MAHRNQASGTGQRLLVLSRISSTLLDRIDMHVEVPALSLQDLSRPPEEGSAEVASRVLVARSIQQRRFGGDSAAPVNAALGSDGLRRHAVLEPDARRLLDTAFERLKLSAHAVDSALRVARTVADLDGRSRSWRETPFGAVEGDKATTHKLVLIIRSAPRRSGSRSLAHRYRRPDHLW